MWLGERSIVNWDILLDVLNVNRGLPGRNGSGGPRTHADHEGKFDSAACLEDGRFRVLLQTGLRRRPAAGACR